MYLDLICEHSCSEYGPCTSPNSRTRRSLGRSLHARMQCISKILHNRILRHLLVTPPHPNQLLYVESEDTHTMAIYTEAKINHKLPPTEHRIGLSGSLALRCAAFSKCCAAQCQTLRETDLLLSRPPFVRFSLAPVYMVLVSVCTLFNACCSLSLCACGL